MSAPTEERNPNTHALDSMSTLELLQTLNREDAQVASAVQRILPALAVVVDLAVERVRAGGTVHYFGAGTSGRLAVIDAAELMPTFNAPDGLFVAHHAGGAGALLKAVENVEDNADLGAAEASKIGPLDVIIGITA
ncbi:MAG: N-acetylmuramic acid 6-phosphate etherase, partial [Dermatophilaceae bacterium]